MQGNARRRLLVGTMLISTFMAAMESTVISTAMPTIVDQLGGFELFSWAFGVYLLTQAVTTPVYGRLADLYGRKRVYIGSTALFLLGSLLCGLAWSMPSLILFRAVQGFGSGGLAPIATTIISDTAAPAERPKALGQISAIWGISAILGPIIGAFCVSHASWPLVFWINLPIGLTTIALVGHFLREQRETVRHPLDLAGSALLMLAAGAVMTALVQHQSLPPLLSLALLGVGVGLGVVLVRHERAAAEPTLPLHLWRQPIILIGNVSGLLCGAFLIGLTGFLPLYIQGVQGRSPLDAGLTLGTMSVSWTIASMVVGRLLARVSYRATALVGGLAVLAGSAGPLGLTPLQPPGWILAAAAIVGAGLGMLSITFAVCIQSSVAWQDRGRATSLFYFCRLVGQALGAAAFGGVLNAGMPGALPQALHQVFALAAALAVVILLVSLLVPSRVTLRSQLQGD
ncbi:MAG: MFS transporter [Acidisphaera sp.]|nr:MFS transporter [Acidisphaera sp.]